MDNLAMDAIRCKNAGMSYGQWKATHPIIRVVDADDGAMEKSCAHCGERFKTRNKRKIYCCERCGQLEQQARRKEKEANGEQWKR